MIDKIEVQTQIQIHDDFKFHEVYVINIDDNTREIIKLMMPKQQYIPKEKDKLWFMPECDVPRFKVREFCQKYKCAIVKSKENATVKFIAEGTFQKMIQSYHNYCFHKDSFLEYMIQAVGSNPDFTELIEAIKSSTGTHVRMSYSLNEKLKNNVLGIPFKLEHDDNCYYVTRFTNKEAYELYQEICTDPAIVSQSEILKRINTGTVMTAIEHDSVTRMLKSTDDGNVKVAIEIMANCDYERSAVYLLMLIKDHGRKIHDCPTSKHVNFKALMRFFDIKNIYNFTLDDVIAALLRRNLLNRDNLDKIMPIAKDLISKQQATRYFEPAMLTYNKKIEKGLKENVLDGQCDTEVFEDEEELLIPNLNFNE